METVVSQTDIENLRRLWDRAPTSTKNSVANSINTYANTAALRNVINGNVGTTSNALTASGVSGLSTPVKIAIGIGGAALLYMVYKKVTKR